MNQMLRKIFYLIVLCNSLVSFGSIKDFPQQPFRNWKNLDGNKISGQLLSFNQHSKKVKIHSNYPSRRMFWYRLDMLSTPDQEHVRCLNENFVFGDLYDSKFYETTDQLDWKFFDKKYCDVTLEINYDELQEVPKIFNYDHKTGHLKNCILYLWDNPNYDPGISNMIREFNFRPKGQKLHTGRKSFTDGILANVEVLHYLGLQPEDFKKLRWFFSAEDFAFYPEKIYKFLGVLEKTSRIFDEEKLFHQRHAKGIPIILYWDENGLERSRWCNFYNSPSQEEIYPRCSKISPPKPKKYTKIIYLKTN